MNTPIDRSQKANILVVDDTSSNLRILSQLLQDEGYEVSCALDGATALTIAGSGWPNIILLDILMPEMDGYEICQQLKASKKTRHIPVIFLSNLEDVFDKKKAFEVGGVDYIPKSFDSQEIIIRIKNQLAIQSAKLEILRLNTELENRVKARTNELELINQKLQQEIDRRQQAQDAMLRKALKDSLTGLANRNAFIARVQKAIRYKQSNSDYQYAIFLLECDRFNEIKYNDGYLEANRFLIEIANQISSCFPQSACISRFEGDDFAILVDLDAKPQIIKDLAIKTQNQLEQSFKIDNRHIAVKNCMGIVLGKKEYLQVDSLLHDANLALQASKSENKYQIFDERKHYLFKSAKNQKLKLEKQLKRAISDREFVIYYQPILSLTTSKITELSAFIYWNHPQKGIINFSKFIPLIEESELLREIEDFLLFEACQNIVQLQGEHNFELKVNIQLSHSQFLQSDLVTRINKIINRTQIKPQSLYLAIPEQLIYQNPQLATKHLTYFKESNINISILNFGDNHCPLTYLALTYLNQFSINRVIIDSNLLEKNFSNKYLTKFEKNTISYCEKLINLARKMNVSILIDNLRLNKQLKYFQDWQCNLGQGIIISKPLEGKALEELLLWSTF